MLACAKPIRLECYDNGVNDDVKVVRVILGAGDQRWDGWIPTQREDLNLLEPLSFERWFGGRRARALLCEHVWEHLSESQGRAAAQLCFQYLEPGGYLRCAVPDGFFPDPEYQRTVQIGGPGPADHPAADHQIVYEYQRFTDVFTSAGFTVDLLEYCDERGRFHYHQWDASRGPVYRSLLMDHRNRHGTLKFASLILDAHKPLE